MRNRILLVTLLLFTSTGAAQIGEYGHVVPDIDRPTAQLKTNGPDDLKYIDGTGNGLSSDDPIFLAQSSSLEVGDIALNDEGGLDRGEAVSGTNSQLDETLADISGSLAFFDDNGNGVFDGQDVMLWDRNGNGEDRYSTDDLILSGDRAGLFPTGDTHGINALLDDDISATFSYLDSDDSGGYTAGDHVYLDVGNDRYATTSDIRFTAHDDLPFGGMLTLDSPDAALLLKSSGAPTTFGYIDEGGDGTFQASEPVYLLSGLSSGLGSVRLVGSDFGDAGTQVRGSDNDSKFTRSSLSGELAATGDGDESIEEGEILIYNLNEGQSDIADGRDIILSGEHAGRYVADVDGVHGLSVEPVDENILYLDTDANGGYDLNDVVYYDGDDNGFVSEFDVQLSGPPTWYTVPQPAPDADDDGVPDDDDNCPDHANEDQADEDGDGVGDACEPEVPDADGDGVPDDEDNCPDEANADQADEDGDGVGDACEPEVEDADGDGVPDDEDNCPDDANADQADADSDGMGDGCDTDGDGDDDGGEAVPGLAPVLVILALAFIASRRR